MFLEKDYVEPVENQLIKNKMTQPKLTSCQNCNIQALINEIDCKLFDAGIDLYNNITLMLNRKIDGSSLFSLMQYRRILHYKYCNPDYGCMSIEQIANRIKYL